jgi:hypothetical protein
MFIQLSLPHPTSGRVVRNPPLVEALYRCQAVVLRLQVTRKRFAEPEPLVMRGAKPSVSCLFFAPFDRAIGHIHL